MHAAEASRSNFDHHRLTRNTRSYEYRYDSQFHVGWLSWVQQWPSRNSDEVGENLLKGLYRAHQEVSGKAIGTKGDLERFGFSVTWIYHLPFDVDPV